jgi:hypothetical protein
MAIRILTENDSLETLWSELVYTEARLANDARVARLAAPIEALLVRVEKIRSGQLAAWRAELQAQAAVDAADDSLEDAVDMMAKDILHAANQDRTHPTYTRYFSRPSNAVLRLGLESELSVVSTWTESLRVEEERAIAVHAKPLEKIIATGKDALEQRAKAQAARAEHRHREMQRLTEDVNAARRSLYGVLVQRGQEAGMPRDYADRFYRHATKASKSRAATPIADAPTSVRPPRSQSAPPARPPTSST